MLVTNRLRLVRPHGTRENHLTGKAKTLDHLCNVVILPAFDDAD